jgi:8-amino-7-oxononanoate synthase
VAIDRHAYPLAFTAAARPAMRGVPVITYDHHDAAALKAIVRQWERRPVVVTDGWCPDCGQPAPLAALAEFAAASGGHLVVDDTLAAGVLGRAPDARAEFGHGGGGTFAWLGTPPGPATVVVASLAKAYGAPLTVTAGPEVLIERLRFHGSRWDNSPPSAADVAAAHMATIDEVANDRCRRYLARLVSALRRGLAAAGLRLAGRLFPMVSVIAASRQQGWGLHRQLAAGGVVTLLRAPRCAGQSAVTFAVTADHRPRDIDRVLHLLVDSGRGPCREAA